MRSWGMFRATDRQIPLWHVAARLPESAKGRLRASWAEGFQTKVLPILLVEEATFGGAYDLCEGRPNWSVARMLGVLVLQDLNDLDDRAALDALTFDARWQHALSIEPEVAYLSRRSLVDFRSRLVRLDPEMKLVRRLFEKVGDAAINDLGVKIGKQRIDSTLVTSNIRTRGRGDLFRKTLEHFLAGLKQHWPDRLERLNPEVRAWSDDDGEGWFARGNQGRAKARKLLTKLAGWLHEVRVVFARDEPVVADERYQLVVRVLNEHCEVLPSAVADGDDRVVVSEPDDAASQHTVGQNATGSPSPGNDVDEQPETHPVPESEPSKAAQTRPPLASNAVAPDGAPDVTQNSGQNAMSGPGSVVIRKTQLHPGSSLQSPFDPDAGYGTKGAGYLVHVAETCGNDGAEVITDFEVTGAGCGDKGKTTDALERLDTAGRLPEVLFADGGFTTGEATLEAEKLGVKLHAPANLGRLPEGTIGREQFRFTEAGDEVFACPAGYAPLRHAVRSTHSNRSRSPAVHAYFDGQRCRACPFHGRCVARPPNNGKSGNYHLEMTANLRARDQCMAEQSTQPWWDAYRIRSGIEATNSELKRAHGFGRLRVRRYARVTLAIACKLIACNVKRWLRVAAKGPERVTPDPTGQSFCPLVALRCILGWFTPRWPTVRPTAAWPSSYLAPWRLVQAAPP